MNLLKPEIKITIEKEENHFVLLLLSDVLAKNVFVDSDIDGSFSDNFFDLIPGEEKRIEFYPEEDIDERFVYSIFIMGHTGKTVINFYSNLHKQ